MFKPHHAIIPAIAALALLGVGIAACAAQVDQSPEDQVVAAVDQRVDELLDEIQATDAQRKRVHEMEDELIAEVKQARQEHEQTHAVIEELWLADQVDANKAHALVDERIDGIRAKAHRVTDAALELHALLTAEQRRVLVERAKERRQQWRHRWHDAP